MIQLRGIENRGDDHRCNFCTRSEALARALVVNVDPRMSDIEKANAGTVYTISSTTVSPNPVIHICGHCFIVLLNEVVEQTDDLVQIQPTT